MRQTRWIGIVAAVLLGMLVLAGSGGCRGASADQKAYDNLPALTTVQEFEEKVEQADRPVLVDFYATWCGPCKRLAPTIGSLALEYGDRVDFYRVDTDQARALAEEMKITGIPTVFIYVDGEPIHKSHGAARETFAKVLDKAIEQASQ